MSARLLLRPLTALLLSSLLAGCGFQLRGGDDSSVLPPEWRRLTLVSNSPNSEFTRLFRALGAARGIEWVAPADADYRLRLGDERFTQRNLSINAQARASEFELLLRTTFSITDAEGGTVLPPTEAEVAKQMENDPLNVVGKAEESRILREEMREELARQIVRRISFFAASR